jgi:alkylated DNA repair dioxygenase AlkB
VSHENGFGILPLVTSCIYPGSTTTSSKMTNRTAERARNAAEKANGEPVHKQTEWEKWQQIEQGAAMDSTAARPTRAAASSRVADGTGETGGRTRGASSTPLAASCKQPKGGEVTSAEDAAEEATGDALQQTAAGASLHDHVTADETTGVEGEAGLPSAPEQQVSGAGDEDDVQEGEPSEKGAAEPVDTTVAPTPATNGASSPLTVHDDDDNDIIEASKAYHQEQIETATPASQAQVSASDHLSAENAAASESTSPPAQLPQDQQPQKQGGDESAATEQSPHQDVNSRRPVRLLGLSKGKLAEIIAKPPSPQQMDATPPVPSKPARKPRASATKNLSATTESGRTPKKPVKYGDFKFPSKMGMRDHIFTQDDDTGSDNEESKKKKTKKSTVPPKTAAPLTPASPTTPTRKPGRPASTKTKAPAAKVTPAKRAAEADNETPPQPKKNSKASAATPAEGMSPQPKTKPKIKISQGEGPKAVPAKRPAPEDDGDESLPQSKPNSKVKRSRPSIAERVPATDPATEDDDDRDETYNESSPQPEKEITTSRTAAPKTAKAPAAKKTPTAKKTPAAKKTPTAKKARTPKISLTPPSSQSASEGPDLLRHVDQKILELSRALTQHTKVPLSEKPEPHGQPRVWADSRQALCETVPYFKKPQGGCHANDRHVYAFLFDGVGHCREYMDTNVIIARAGGGMESDSTGSMVQGKDQSMSEAQVQSVINDVAYQNPLIIISGERNTGTPSKMPHKYCVLGWYKPIMVWAEKTAGKGKKNWTTIKYRFERLNRQKPAWHAPKDQNELQIPDEAKQLHKETCESCHTEYPQIYLVSWMCLNPKCEQFWQLEDGTDAPCGALDYNPAFLRSETTWANEEEPFDVRPQIPEFGKLLGDNLTKINTRGICCPQCGRCNPRYKYSGWVCDNPTCDWHLESQHRSVVPASLHQPWDTFGDGPSLARNKHEAGVNLSISYVKGYKVNKYTFDGVKGSFIHAVANNQINREELGPDAMFSEIQTQDMGLERRRFGIEKLSGNKAEKAAKEAAKNDEKALKTPKSKVSGGEEERLLTPLSESVVKQVPIADADGDTVMDAQQAEPVPGDASSAPPHGDTVMQLQPTEPVSGVLPSDPQTAEAVVHAQPVSALGTAESSATPSASQATGEAQPEESDVVMSGALPAPEADKLSEVPIAETQEEDAIEVEVDKINAVATKKSAEEKNAEPEAGDFMTAFSMNYGMPYKFVASGASQPFTNAPWPVKACRSRLNWAQKEFLNAPEGDMDFNEELIFAYLEGQKIEYHDDGESGLGPRIATLSLGGKAKMHLRTKAKYHFGCSKTGIMTADKPLPGTVKYEERLEAWNELQQLRESDRAAYTKRLKELPKELGIFEKRNKKAHDLVTVTLNHGDIIVMDGDEIQKYLEHKVVPESYLRFALTCRTVLHDHLKPEELPSYTVAEDDFEFQAPRML